jgi:hypothetical protein
LALLTEISTANDLVVITARRLDSEDVEEATIEVDVPQSEAGQRAQLTGLVHARYPDAEFRSFANEAASFLAHKVLVVAVYRRSSDRLHEAIAGDDETQQQQLFAA